MVRFSELAGTGLGLGIGLVGLPFGAGALPVIGMAIMGGVVGNAESYKRREQIAEAVGTAVEDAIKGSGDSKFKNLGASVIKQIVKKTTADVLDDLDQLKAGNRDTKFQLAAGRIALREVAGIDINKIVLETVKAHVPCGCQPFIAKKIVNDVTPAIVQAVKNSVQNQAAEGWGIVQAVYGVGQSALAAIGDENKQLIVDSASAVATNIASFFTSYFAPARA